MSYIIGKRTDNQLQTNADSLLHKYLTSIQNVQLFFGHSVKMCFFFFFIISLSLYLITHLFAVIPNFAKLGFELHDRELVEEGQVVTLKQDNFFLVFFVIVKISDVDKDPQILTNADPDPVQ